MLKQYKVVQKSARNKIGSLLLCVLPLLTACEKEAEQAEQGNEDFITFEPPLTSTPGPPPPPDSFVIRESEYASIRKALLRRDNGSFQTQGYPRGDFLNDDKSTDYWTPRYKTIDTLEISLTGPSNGMVILELSSKDIQNLRTWITKYRRWKGESEEKALPEGVSKSLGMIGLSEVLFVTPNLLKLGNVVLEPNKVDALEKVVTTSLPWIRMMALERIRKAEKIIAAEDQRWESLKRKRESERATVDAILR